MLSKRTTWPSHVFLLLSNLLLFTSILTANEFDFKGKLGISKLDTDHAFYNGNTNLANLVGNLKYTPTDKDEFGMIAEVVTSNYKINVNKGETTTHNVNILFLEEMYYKRALVKNFSVIAGKLDYRSDDREIFALPDERKVYVNPIMINAVIDGVFIAYDYDALGFSVGYTKYRMFGDTRLMYSGDVLEDPYGNYSGLFFNGVLSAGDDSSFLLNYYRLTATTRVEDLDGAIYGFSYIWDDSVASGYTAYLHTTYSSVRISESAAHASDVDVEGYGVLAGLCKNGDLPIINNEYSLGFETMVIKDDLVSLNTGAFLSIYDSKKNGTMVNVYGEVHVSKTLSVKALFSKLYTDGDTTTRRTGVARVNVPDLKDQYDVRFELIFNF